MQEKEAKRQHDSIRSFSSFRFYFKSFLFGFFSKASNVKTFLIPGRTKQAKGFTLIELILVIGILSILSIGSIAILNPIAQFQKANDAKRKSDLYQIQRAIEVYYGDNGKYPPDYSVSDFRIKGLDGNVVAWGSPWPPYIDALPKDPSGSKKYVYFSGDGGQSYYLYANLDRGTDPTACNGGNECSSISTNGIAANSCGGSCNFGLTSPNVSP